MSSQYNRTGFKPVTLLPLLLSCAALLVAALVGPATGQEIVIKSMNLNQAAGSVVDPTANSLQPQPPRQMHQPQQQQQQQQQQPQQQQRLQYKSNPQDAHLKSLTVYASNYDSISSNNDQNSNNNNNNNKLSAFKPSYNYNSINHNNNKRPLFEFETQFTPLQTHAAGVTLSGPATHPVHPAQPVIMQYLPQTVHQAGVQYLQLIPTRPLIVPIGHYLPGANAATAQVSADVGHNNNNHVYHQSPAPALATNTITDYSVHAPALLNSVPVNVAPPAPAPAPLMEIPAAPSLPYGLPTYAQSIQPYRSYRFNREIKPRNLSPLSPSVNLNMYEYVPVVHEALPAYGRGKP